MYRSLPIGIDEFPELRSLSDCLYVDKTRQIADLCSLLLGKQPQLFLSRPRRFGKTLLLSTLQSLFLGERHWFEDTWIGKEGRWNWDGRRYPVLRLNMGVKNAVTRSRLEKRLVDRFVDAADLAGIAIDHAPEAEIVLAQTIRRLHKLHGQPVVLLIDEYDTPITESVGHPETLPEVMSVMRSVYGALKDERRRIRCTFMTGVTRIAKAGLFSGANHFRDISFSPAFNSLLGFTEDELQDIPDLRQAIADCARITGCPVSDMEAALRRHYNGYQFSRKNEKVYNPYSLAECFAAFSESQGVVLPLDQLPNAWAQSGTPDLLFQLWKARGTRTHDLSYTHGKPTLAFLEETNYDVTKPNMTVLMYQAGYLTLTQDAPSHDPNLLRLDFPNQEVKQTYMEALHGWQEDSVAEWHGREREERRAGVAPMHKALREGNAQDILSSLDNYFQQFSYPLHAVPKASKEYYDYENHYRTLVCAALYAGGEMSPRAEVPTARGHIDILVEAGTRILCLECKTEGTAVYALQQAWDKGYVDRCRMAGKSVTVVGLKFDRDKRTITEAAVWKLGRYDAKLERWEHEPFVQADHSLTQLSRMEDDETRSAIIDAWDTPTKTAYAIR